jgi:hypothetical protein
MNLEQLKDAFLVAGYKEHRHDKPGVVALLQGKVDPSLAPACKCNDKLFITATVWSFPVHEGTQHEGKYETVAFDITAEYGDGRWVEIKVYSLPWKEAAEKLEEIEADLIRAWKAIAEVRSPGSQDAPYGSSYAAARWHPNPITGK